MSVWRQSYIPIDPQRMPLLCKCGHSHVAFEAVKRETILNLDSCMPGCRCKSYKADVNAPRTIA